MPEKTDPGRASSGRFQRVRRDHSRETAEDYAELVLELGQSERPVRPADLGRRLGVSHVTVLRTVERLIRAGVLARDEIRGVALTRAGRRIALAARRRHQRVVAFLLKLGVPPGTAELDAEGIEHHVSAATLARMTEFAGRRRRGIRPRGRARGAP